MIVSTLQWGVLISLIIGLFLFDLLISNRNQHEFTAARAGRWIAFYVAFALAFGLWLKFTWGSEYAMQFAAGYVTEYSLSVDNLFVFLVILQSFRVPRAHWHKVLLIGISLSLLLRAVVILLGVALIERFIATFILFGLFLIWTAWKVAFQDEEASAAEGMFVRWLRKILPMTDDFHDQHLSVRIDGKRHFTPLALVMVAISVANLLFALDSIPAILGLTQESFIVIAANAFALMGLRQLFFMVLGLLDRLEYLAHGLALVLAFIGAKLILEAVHELWWSAAPLISTGTSLLVIVLVLSATALASLTRPHRGSDGS